MNTADARLFREISSAPATIWRAAEKLETAYQRIGWRWGFGPGLQQMLVPDARDIAGMMIWLLSSLKPGGLTGSGGITVEQPDHHDRYLVRIDPRLDAALQAHLAEHLATGAR